MKINPLLGATVLTVTVLALAIILAGVTVPRDKEEPPSLYRAPSVEPFAVLKGDPHPAYLHCINGDVFAITGNSITPIYLEMQPLRCSDVVIHDAS